MEQAVIQVGSHMLVVIKFLRNITCYSPFIHNPVCCLLRFRLYSVKETDAICFKWSEQNAKKDIFIREQGAAFMACWSLSSAEVPTRVYIQLTCYSDEPNFALGALCLRNAQKIECLYLRRWFKRVFSQVWHCVISWLVHVSRVWLRSERGAIPERRCWGPLMPALAHTLSPRPASQVTWERQQPQDSQDSHPTHCMSCQLSSLISPISW